MNFYIEEILMHVFTKNTWESQKRVDYTEHQKNPEDKQSYDTVVEAHTSLESSLIVLLPLPFWKQIG